MRQFTLPSAPLYCQPMELTSPQVERGSGGGGSPSRFFNFPLQGQRAEVVLSLEAFPSDCAHIKNPNSKTVPGVMQEL